MTYSELHESNYSNSRPATPEQDVATGWFRPVQKKEKDVSEMTVPEMLHKANALNKDTTRTAKNALKIVEDTKQVSNDMLAVIEMDGQKIVRINQDLDKLQEDMYYSEKLIRYMSSYCWLFTCCCDPEYARRAARRQRKKQQEAEMQRRYLEEEEQRKLPPLSAYEAPGYVDTPSKDGLKFGTTRLTGPATPDTAPQPKLPKDSFETIHLGEQFSKQEAAMNAEIRTQNHIFDQIDDGLDCLLESAQVMNQELTERMAGVDELQNKVEYTMIKVASVNKQVRDLHRNT